MTCAHTSSGNPDCPHLACRTRWLAGSTTGEPFTPWPTLRGLVVDVLETWCGEWMSRDDISRHVLRIRPAADPESVSRVVDRMIARPPAALRMRADLAVTGTTGTIVRVMWAHHGSSG